MVTRRDWKYHGQFVMVYTLTSWMAVEISAFLKLWPVHSRNYLWVLLVMRKNHTEEGGWVLHVWLLKVFVASLRMMLKLKLCLKLPFSVHSEMTWKIFCLPCNCQYVRHEAEISIDFSISQVCNRTWKNLHLLHLLMPEDRLLLQSRLCSLDTW